VEKKQDYTKKLIKYYNNSSQYICSIVVCIIIPLLPLFLEYWFTNKISCETISITVALYSISIGSISQRVEITILSLVPSLFFCATFGYLKRISNTINLKNPCSKYLEIVAVIAIIFISIFFLIERFFIHVRNQEKFLFFEEHIDKLFCEKDMNLWRKKGLSQDNVHVYKKKSRPMETLFKDDKNPVIYSKKTGE